MNRLKMLLILKNGEKMNNKILGNDGEKEATEYLIKNGYKIIERNFFCKRGEIDIIAKDGDTIVFIEVKTRKSI